MQTNDTHEREVKFYISDPQGITNRLQSIGAIQIKNRVHEYNLRFDTAKQDLRQNHQVLRLRKDSANHLTYKGASDNSEGIADREELEITVSDFGMTRSILEALGYTPFMIYEKYRTTYIYKECEIVLDELPFGYFIEIEGTSVEKIKEIAMDVGVNWEKRITASYLELFQTLQRNKNIQAHNILFSEFSGLDFTEADFNRS
ncbi:MAG TPA: class IV adenylate cyclase [Anaerolineaceae bacterium]|nr:class IV adenylate cyclase [Anaerolineaceae bacterium]